MEWLGTVSFAISGAIVAIGASLDLFGVLMIGCITAVGGGITRDLLVGNVPPRIFFVPSVLLVAILSSAVVFVVAYCNKEKFNDFRKRVEFINNLFDAMGLAAFSVTGIEIACSSHSENNVLFIITLGVLTGVGGGILRDVLVNEKPYILTKHIYAVVSIIGCSLYYFVGVFFGYRVVGTFLVIIIVVSLRLLAAKYRWRFPKIRFDDKKHS